MSGGGDDFVVLFKSVSESENAEDDVYFNKFQTANFQVMLIPVLDFDFVNLDELLIKLKNPNHYEGIIYTSPRCVTGVKLSVQKENDLSVLEKWQKHKHLVVGEKTAQMVEKLKFIAVGKESGNAKNLAEIMSRDHYDKPFLYLKGSLTKDNFKSLLKENNIEVDDILIYQTKCHPGLEKHIEKIKFYFFKKTVYFIYFSPSGVNFTLPLLQKHQFDLGRIKFVAIGSTTKEALLESGLKVAATSIKPDPQSLLDAVLTYKKDET